MHFTNKYPEKYPTDTFLRLVKREKKKNVKRKKLRRRPKRKLMKVDFEIQYRYLNFVQKNVANQKKKTRRNKKPKNLNKQNLTRKMKRKSKRILIIFTYNTQELQNNKKKKEKNKKRPKQMLNESMSFSLISFRIRLNFLKGKRTIRT